MSLSLPSAYTFEPSLLLPECAVCGKNVDRVRTWVDQNCARYHFAFFCHGAKETVEMSEEFAEQWLAGGAKLGACFLASTPALAAGAKALP